MLIDTIAALKSDDYDMLRLARVLEAQMNLMMTKSMPASFQQSLRVFEVCKVNVSFRSQVWLKNSKGDFPLRWQYLVASLSPEAGLRPSHNFLDLRLGSALCQGDMPATC